MDLKVKGKKCVVSKDLDNYTRTKLQKLEKLNKRLLSAAIVFTEESSKKRSRSHRVEVVMRAPGQVFRAESKSESFYIAIDDVADKLKRQLKKLKTKRIDKTREAAAAGKKLVAAKDGTTEPAGTTPAIQIEHYSSKPISTAEAIMMLKKGKRSFMLFVSNDNTVNCVYKDAEGSLRLILPENQE